MNNENIDKIKEAMLQFGCRGKVTAKLIGADRYIVRVDGEYFGVWDVTKETFVD